MERVLMETKNTQPSPQWQNFGDLFEIVLVALSFINSEYELILKHEIHSEERLSWAIWKTSAIFPISEIAKAAS